MNLCIGDVVTVKVTLKGKSKNNPGLFVGETSSGKGFCFSPFDIKSVEPKEIDRTQDFRNFYLDYPKKVGRSAALKAYTRVRQTLSERQVNDKLDIYKKKWAQKGLDKSEIPNATEWLNNLTG